MATLITGAGLIGCLTAQRLAARGDDVVLLDARPAHGAIASIASGPRVAVVQGDVTDFEALSELVAERRVTRIVHTAALLSKAIREAPLDGVRVNIVGTANVLEVARTLRLERVVIAGSSTILYPTFGDAGAEAVPEDFPLKFLSHRPGSIYSASKMAAEHLSLLYRDQHGVSAVVLRFAAVIGAWSGPGHSIPGKALSALVAPAQRGEMAVIDDPDIVWKGGDEFVDARDCAAANLAALDAPSPAQGVYNVGMGSLSTFDDFVDAVRRLYPSLQMRLAVTPAAGFAGFPHVRRAASDITAAARELGWRPQHDLYGSIAHFAPLLGPGAAGH